MGMSNEEEGEGEERGEEDTERMMAGDLKIPTPGTQCPCNLCSSLPENTSGGHLPHNTFLHEQIPSSDFSGDRSTHSALPPPPTFAANNPDPRGPGPFPQSPAPALLRCTNCNREFGTKRGLVNHQRRCSGVLDGPSRRPSWGNGNVGSCRGDVKTVPEGHVKASRCLYPDCNFIGKGTAQMLKHMHHAHKIPEPADGKCLHESCPEGCGARINKWSPQAFAAHLESKHSWCLLCNFPCDRLARHFWDMHVPHAERYECPMRGCVESFEEYGDLLEHYWKSEGHLRAVAMKVKEKVAARWKCPLCGEGREFQREAGVLVHFEAVHRLGEAGGAGTGTGDEQTGDDGTYRSTDAGDTYGSADLAAGGGTHSSMGTSTGSHTSSSMEISKNTDTQSSIRTALNAHMTTEVETQEAYAKRRPWDLMSISSIPNNEQQPIGPEQMTQDRHEYHGVGE